MGNGYGAGETYGRVNKEVLHKIHWKKEHTAWIESGDLFGSSMKWKRELVLLILVDGGSKMF